MAAPPYTYRALRPIHHGGVRAYSTGDLVPAANVTALGYEVGVDVAVTGDTPAPDPAATTSPASDGDGDGGGEAAKTPARRAAKTNTTGSPG